MRKIDYHAFLIGTKEFSSHTLQYTGLRVKLIYFEQILIADMHLQS